VLLYNKETRAENPMRCVEFKNTTGLTLEGGPVTVLEGGSYVGEAMLDTLKPDEDRLIPYSVELGVSVLDNVDSHAEEVSRVVIRDRMLTTFREQRQQTTYSFNNKAGTEQTVYLDHTRGGDWSLFETPEPLEVTENYWRFRFDLTARKVTRFVVRQRATLEHMQHFSTLNTEQLAFWIDWKRLDDKTRKALKQIVEAQHALADRDRQVNELRGDNTTIDAEQKRIRENLQALGDRAGEKQLRERYVQALNDQEDRLQQIAKEIKSRTEEREKARVQLDALIGGLAYESTPV
jgi:hypothetical protein